MSKTYDRVEWAFLEGMMRQLGFADRWVRLIMECVTSVSYSIPFDNSEIVPIFPTRGLCQGDPLSPYLFILVAEGLSVLLQRYEAASWLHGVAVARPPQESHIFSLRMIFSSFSRPLILRRRLLKRLSMIMKLHRVRFALAVFRLQRICNKEELMFRWAVAFAVREMNLC
ncbi:unnamed protein product [Cuscuta epithymum]|uniref:Reverse transcriptase domain-containing protein n=1 Tax=Cuscuta epithymum TaxID=186058 RepID=A0AAV0G7D6_9ASTE|nr:unnamed protein product [Cuscuta epithymum]